jgi:hypothetical protein
MKKNAKRWWTWAHNVEGCLRNGSFVRTSKDQLAQYMNGDFMGLIDAVPDGMIEVVDPRLINTVPTCCGR